MTSNELKQGYKSQEALRTNDGIDRSTVVARPDYGEELSAEYVAYKPVRPMTRAIISKKRRDNSDELSQEAIIGEDERERVIPDKYPYTAICSLRIRSASGARYMGTGFFISPRVLLTAGHCVYVHSDGGWVESIEVIPARNGTDSPYGTAVSETFFSLGGWIEDKDKNYDFGVIVLPEDSPLGKNVGWFGYKALRREKEYVGKTLNISGYPGDKGGKEQWWMSGEGEVQGPLLKYDIDTFGGQSGSPVWATIGGREYVLGVHTMGNSRLGNFATRINMKIIRDIREICKANP